METYRSQHVLLDIILKIQPISFKVKHAQLHIFCLFFSARYQRPDINCSSDGRIFNKDAGDRDKRKEGGEITCTR